MAVAVKNTTDSQTRPGTASLAVSSILGAVYVLAAAALVAQGIPYLWQTGIAPLLPANLSFVSAAGLIVVLLFGIGLLAVLGSALVGPSPPKGLRAGVFTVLAWLAGATLITVWVGRILESLLGGAPLVGLVLTAAVGLGLLFWGWLLLNRPKAAAKLQAFEDQGWFSAARYKASQGLRVRRGTMLGLLLLAGAGIFALYTHGPLVTGPNDWLLRVPFSRSVVPHPAAPPDSGMVLITERFIPILPDVKFTVPLLLGAAAFWLSFRMVNLPVFADFLIATEAEVNKVSWPARKSVVQDTIVVLVTVLLMTVFLFVVDLTWGWVLSHPWVRVLQVTPQQQAEQKQAEQKRLQDQIDW
jgi:preprotein translocase SecE subunit